MKVEMGLHLFQRLNFMFQAEH